jgi:hypothetical protein
MDKTDENIMVDIAENEIKRFAEEWMNNPYLWESETDVHAELYMRIKKSLHLHDKFSVRKYKYKDMVKEEYFDWIYCKPKTYIKGASYPDLIIYKDTDKKHDFGDTDNEPMLWACEIKYATNWSSLLSKEGVKKDIKKLETLLERTCGGVDHACYLIMLRKVSLSKSVENILNKANKKIRVYKFKIKK